MSAFGDGMNEYDQLRGAAIEIRRLTALVSERTGALRRLAAHASYAVTGMWPSTDPFPDHIDELCDGLRGIGDERA